MKTITALFTKASTISAATVIALSFTSTSAFADKTLYPASMCVQWTASDVVPRLSAGRIFNDSTTRTMRVDCPILHQHFGAIFTDDDQNDADIGVIDAHTTQNARCWALSKHQSGSSLISVGNGGTRTTSGFGSAEQNLDFGLVNHNSASWSYIGCEIPPRQNNQSSGITYYSHEE